MTAGKQSSSSCWSSCGCTAVLLLWRGDCWLLRVAVGSTLLRDDKDGRWAASGGGGDDGKRLTRAICIAVTDSV